ncbi:MAG: TIGR02680 family protein, partial [Thermoanaerobaculia bacterium]
MSETLRTPEPEGLLFDGAREGGPPLPRPERERFTPLRAGILNLWQYDDQELRFHQGRLLLRGENGTGKSKALEVLLPFLLDADLSPHRLDPFASTARTMYWNLLEGDKHESRVGYVWMEVGRLEEEPGGGEPRPPRPVYRTVGCGLRATRRSRRVDSWFFVTSRRVGGELELTTPGGVPLLKEELARALGEDGTVYGTGKEYRARVDQELFALGENRFDALRHLLLQLRRPQLSQKLDPASLSQLLAESLPPVEADLVTQLSEGFERLEGDARELARVEAAAREVEGFLGVYRTYAQGVARGRAAEVRRADSAYHRTAAEAREAEAERDALAGELDELAARRDQADGAAARSRGTLRALEQSDAMRSAEA